MEQQNHERDARRTVDAFIARRLRLLDLSLYYVSSIAGEERTPALLEIRTSDTKHLLQSVAFDHPLLQRERIVVDGFADGQCARCNRAQLVTPCAGGSVTHTARNVCLACAT